MAAYTISKKGNYSLGFIWSGSNNGQVGSRNHRATEITVFLCASNEAPAECAIQFEAGKASSKRDADSLARKYIRENGLRDLLKEKAG